jgi:hypothetical protein
MKPAERIEKLIKERRYEASAETYDRALGSFLQAVDDHIKHKAAPTEPRLWRKIMKSRITQLAAAAVIIIAACVVIHQSGGSLDGTTPALAQISENMKQMPWVHAIVEVEGEGQSLGLEGWFGFEHRISANINPKNGKIRHLDALKQIAQLYNPDPNTITISKTKFRLFGGSVRSAFDLTELILKVVEDDANDTLVQETGRYEGKEVKIYKTSGILGGLNSEIELYVDAKKNILLYFKQKSFLDEAETTFAEVNGYFDYPEKGPVSIYDLGVPKSAKIVHPEDDKTTFENTFEEATAVIDSRENWPEPRDLVIAYWQARAAKNYDEMAIYCPGSAKWNRPALRKEEPVEYVFGEVQPGEIEGHLIVPYASRNYFQKHGKYSLKMILSNEKSSKGRYYIISGN